MDRSLRRPRLSLLAHFALLGGVLSLIIGVALSALVASMVRERSVATAQSSATQAVGFVTRLVQTLAQDNGSAKVKVSGQLADATDITFRTLQDVKWFAGYEAYLPSGQVVYSDDHNLIGTKVPVTGGIAAAFKGTVSHTTASARDSAHVREMQARFGSLMRFDIPLQGNPGSKPPAVVRVWIAYGPTSQAVSHDIRRVWLLLGAGMLLFYLGMFRLVASASRRLRRQSESNRRMATHDGLTGLPNRGLLRDRTRQALAATARSGRHVGLMLLDLDRFKEVNDTLGHHYGDELLRQIGKRLPVALRSADTVGRLGGDEFVVMLPDLADAADLWAAAERISAAFDEPFHLYEVTLDVDTSIGMALSPEHGSSFDELLQRADIAMYAAKRANIGAELYSGDLDTHTPSRLQLLGDLRRAITDEGQLLLHYQPKIDLVSGATVGVEALLRWQHPDHGLLPPAEFIPVAERTGVIRPLTQLVLRLALEQAASWRAAGDNLTVAVNVSPHCLLDPGFAGNVAEALEHAGVPASGLEIEITETAIVTEPERAAEVLRELAELGVTLSIDDFGTGYSSMAYLTRLPVTQLKIDREFVGGMTTDAGAEAIVRSSVQLAHHLGLTVVAEGVETPEVSAELLRVGCESAQGYLFARPMPATELAGWLAAHPHELLTPALASAVPAGNPPPAPAPHTPDAPAPRAPRASGPSAPRR